jgi:hypothetical protein
MILPSPLQAPETAKAPRRVAHIAARLTPLVAYTRTRTRLVTVVRSSVALSTRTIVVRRTFTRTARTHRRAAAHARDRPISTAPLRLPLPPASRVVTIAAGAPHVPGGGSTVLGNALLGLALALVFLSVLLVVPRVPRPAVRRRPDRPG